MGYTHYWTFKRAKRGQTAKINAAFDRAILQCQKLVSAYNAVTTDETRLSGYTAHTKPGVYGGLNFNGTADLGHEPFVVREHFKDNLSGNFCKTAQKPYDSVVVACLVILQHYLPDNIEVDSDGSSIDWNAGLELARKFTKNKGLQLPQNIRKILKAI